MTRWKVGDSRSITHRFTREDVVRFFAITGDGNPLHVDAKAARKTAAGGVVVHGMLAATFVSTLIGEHIPGHGALWLSFSVQWREIIRIDDTVRFDAEVRSIRHSTNTMVLGITGTNLNTNLRCLEGEATVMTVEEREDVDSIGSLEGRRVLITGSSGVLGQAVAQQLAAEGARLVLWGRNPERLADVNAKLASHVDSTHAVDLDSTDTIPQALQESLKGGDIYGFVHVAAKVPGLLGLAESGLLGAMAGQWQTNVAAFVQIVQGLLPGMSTGGSIVAVLTQYVIGAPPEKVASYVSAKMALLGVIKSMSVELGPKGIRSNAVSPGMMNTPFSEHLPVRIKQIEAARNPLRRLCEPEDVAQAVNFLLGPRGSFINGVNLPVTGGM